MLHGVIIRMGILPLVFGFCLVLMLIFACFIVTMDDIEDRKKNKV